MFFAVCIHFDQCLFLIFLNYCSDCGRCSILSCSFVCCLFLYISRVSDQNGVSLLYIKLEIHHSGREPSIYIYIYIIFYSDMYKCTKLAFPHYSKTLLVTESPQVNHMCSKVFI